VLMLRDPMPNVASAAAYCLYKISSLFIGVTALVQHRVPKMLLNIICSSEDNLTLKISTAETLLQIHRLDPTLPIVGHDNIKMMIRSTSDVTFRNVLLLLLDLWGEARLPIKTNETIEFHLASLRAGGLDVRTGSTSMLLSSVAQDRNLLLQIIAAGGIQVIVKNLIQTPREEPLARLSMAILCLACDVSMGRSSLIGYGAIPTVLAEFQATDFALHLYYVCRFFEVACQYPDTTEVFLESRGLEQTVLTVIKYAEKPSLQTLTMPCLGALKYMALLNPVLLHKHPELVTIFSPVGELYRRMIRKAYDHLMQMPSNAHKALSSESAYEIVLSGYPDEREFYQLLHTVVSLWKPEVLDVNRNNFSKRKEGDQGSVPSVPMIDDELRLASEKLVTLLSTQSRRTRRPTHGSPTSTARALDAISELESEESLSRKASVVLDRGEDDDLMAAADSILADLEVSTSSSSLKAKSSLSLNLAGTSHPGLTGQIDAMDNGIDQLLADIASESIRSARSRSATATDREINDAIQDIERGDSQIPSSADATPSTSVHPSEPTTPTASGMIPSLHTSADIPNPDGQKMRGESTPRTFANSLGGTLMGGPNTPSIRPRFVPQLSVGDMWDDIADLTTSILAEVPSEPSTPSSTASASLGGASSEPSARDSPLRRSSDSQEHHFINSARSQRRSSLNLSSSGQYDIDSEYSMAVSSPVFTRGGLRPASGAASPAGSPRSASSPPSDSMALSGLPNYSPRGKISSPRLDIVLESGSSSPKREKTHSRKTSGGGSTSARSHSPSKIGRSVSETEDLEGSGLPTESPGRRKNRKSIQILSASLDSGADSPSVSHSGSEITITETPNVVSPRSASADTKAENRKSKHLSAELHIGDLSSLGSSSPSKSARKSQNPKRLSSELEDVVASLSLSSPPPEDSDHKKLKRKSSAKFKDKEIEKKDKDKEKSKKDKKAKD